MGPPMLATMAARGTETASAAVLRIGISLVFLWFGVNQILRPDAFLGWLPDWVFNLPVSEQVVVQVHGFAEAFLAAALAIGVLTRVSAILLAGQLLAILASIIALGSMEIAIRDFGILVGTLAVAIRGADPLALDSWRSKD